VFDRGGLLGLVALALYVVVAPAHIVDGDNAEMATLGTVGGAAHPTGYPAYLIWLRLTSWLPSATPAHTAAIATAILGAASVVMLHAACRAWGARPVAATVTAAMFAVAPAVLRYNSEAEAFAMNGLVVATILWLAAANGPLRGDARVAVLAVVAGLGISDHLTCVLAAPVGILGVVRGVRESTHRATTIGAGIVALALGLLPYLYLAATAENAVSWGGLDSAGALVDHLLRRAYGGAGSFSPHSGELHVGANLVALGVSLGRAWLWLPLAGGLWILGYQIARPGDGEPRSSWLMLALAFVIAGPILATRFDVEPTGLGLYVVRRFHLLPTLLLAPAVAIAVDRGYQLIARVRVEIIAVLACACVVTSGLIAVTDVARVRTPAVENGLHALLVNLPPNAVVLLSGDLPYLGAGYLQVARGERPDVIVALWHFVGVRWFRDRLARRGLVVDSRDDAKPSIRIAEEILASGRPLFVDLSLGNILKELPSYPYGTLFRILPRGTPVPSLDDVVAQNRAWFASIDLDYPPPGTDDEYPTQIHAGYAATWRILAEAFAARGQRAQALDAATLAQQIGPQP